MLAEADAYEAVDLALVAHLAAGELGSAAVEPLLALFSTEEDPGHGRDARR